MGTITEAIKKANNVLIVCHIRPDGDSLGAGFSVKRIVEKLGKKADFVCDSDKPSHYSFINGFEELNDRKLDNYDLAISVDCADELRLGKYYGIFKKCKYSINIDHHATNKGFAKLDVIKPDVSSACELLYALVRDDKVIDGEIATLLYLGISTDTGNFMHDNTKSETLKAASELLALGADLNSIVNRFYKNNSKNKIILTGKAIDGLRFFENDTIAVMTVTKAMLEETGCTIADTEGLIDYPMSIGSVRAAVCMTEQNIRSYKVSYRSKDVDVAAAALTFGGGGHKKAAGCVVNGYYEDVVRKVVKSITDGIE